MKIGQIVYSKAGRDKCKFLVVVGFKDGYFLIADGKERPLEKPKLKNPKHLCVTNCCLNKENYKSNRSVRTALMAFANSGKDEF